MVCPKYARERERFFNTLLKCFITPFSYEDILSSKNICSICIFRYNRFSYLYEKLNSILLCWPQSFKLML
ncbi:hypothetical protein O3M35_000744 [Rhynocoris fuscipes]|uniref:Uncharacterized protein n=1 Tax=Rhynocoris fuscipes TaxID=488301 RepID=A0AAW1DNE5_9HEMI